MTGDRARKQTLIPPRAEPLSHSSATATVAGVDITHPDRVLWPDGGITKLDVKAGQQTHHVVGGGRLVGGKKARGVGLRAFLSQNRFSLESREDADKRQQADTLAAHDYYFFP